MRHAVLGVLLLLAVASSAQTSAPHLIANASDRTTISLDSTWNTIIDPYETGVGSRYFENASQKPRVT